MKILFYIPSKNRVDVFCQNSFQWLEKSCDYKVFIEPQDEESYSRVIPKLNLVVLPDNNRGLGYSKICALEYAKENSYDFIFKIDDDVIAFTGRGKGQKQLAAENFLKIINDCTLAFEKHSEVKGIGFPYRNELYEVKKWIGVNARFQTCYITRTDWFHADECVSCFEDFANYMWIRSRNGITLRYGLMGIDCQPIGSGTGGHQDFDRLQQAKAEIDYLKNIYPALIVKRVERPWKIEPRLAGEFFNSKKL